MEKNFYPDNFEQLLKESTDNFRMYPSKRVWHSIYNDLHPSRKWPSLAIWILLISSIVYIGLPTKNQGLAGKDQVATAGNNSKNIAAVAQGSNMIGPAVTIRYSNTVNNVTPVHTRAVLQETFNNTGLKSKSGNQKTVLSNNNTGNNQQPVASTLSNKKSTGFKTKNTTGINVADKNLAANVVGMNVNTVAEKETVAISMDDINDLINNKKETDIINPENKKADVENKNKLSATDKDNTEEKEWIEDYAFHNKPFTSKWKTRTAYQLYFTPSIGYRIFSKNTAFNPVSTALVATSGNVQDYKKALSHFAAVNMEIGGNMLYSITKNWNLKAGIQFNYTNYKINAYELKHPTTTTLTLNDLNTGFPVLDPRSATLANISGFVSKKLNNNTYQVSLPLGADIKIAGKNNLKWYAGATIQPTYIAGGNAYLVSSDLKNYVADESLIRKWNLNAGIETFISYKTKGGIIINAGPQFRYQFLSTYSKQYTYNERLYNLGLKIGITTRF